MKKWMVFVWSTLVCMACSAQEKADYTPEDRAIFDTYVQAMQGKEHLPLGDLLVETAKFFKDRPYVGSTLEKEPERLVINLRELDCTTLVESVLALARTVKAGNPSFEAYAGQLKQLRYRQGEIHDYTDRLHYFSDWIYENQRKGIVRDVTSAIGGEPYRLKMSFMSAHPDKYRQLKAHPEWVEVMREKEEKISSRETYACIPEKEIERCGSGMRNGDIVCFVTNIEGLDISHVGFIDREGEMLTFIHASSSAGKVIVNPESLQTYVTDGKRTTGVMIVRPQEP